MFPIYATIQACWDDTLSPVSTPRRGYIMSVLIFRLTGLTDGLQYERDHINEARCPIRVTAQTKARTRQNILDAARDLFASDGFDDATTRDIADAAGIATGTLFNYFPTKEAVLTSLAAEAASMAHDEFGDGSPDAESFEEDLFAFVAAALRKLKPLRKHMVALLDSALSPLVLTSDDPSQLLRVAHLEVVGRLARKHDCGELPPVALQLYWTLYTGVLTFWSSDRSPRQEDTLALLDHSLAMFVGWLEGQADEPVKRKTKGNVQP